MTGTRLTYGQLMDDARRAAHQANSSLTLGPLVDIGAAQRALTARAELLAAIGRQATVLIGAPRLAIWRDSTPTRRSPEERTPAVLAVLAWIDQLEQRAQGPAPAIPVGDAAAGPPSPAGRWIRSTFLVDRASDLVATHQDPAGRVRPGTPGALARADLGPLLADAARLVSVIAPLEPLALRCRQAGMSREDLNAQLPLTDSLQDDTWALARALAFAPTAVSDLTVARPAISPVDAADEWTQRMARIHARMYRHSQRGHISVRTLHDIARLGLVSSHILATSGRRDHQAQAGVTDQWRAVLAHLDPLRSVERHDRVLRHDVERMLQVAKADSVVDSPRVRERLLDAVAASVPSMDACAAMAERLLAGTSDAWIPARPRPAYLPGRHLPGQAASRAPPLAASWPRTGTTTPRGWGLTSP